MRIHVWGINYSPEVTGIAPYNVALCDSLAKQAHSVRMITSFCYYPAWQKLPSERKLLARTDEMDGVTVHRCWHYVPKKATPIRRILHELSFVCTSFLRQLLLPRPDLLVVISPPLLLGAAAWLLCLLKRARFVFHVQDLQPDAAAGLGMLQAGPMLRSLRGLESFAYKKAVLVSGITPGMLQAFHRKGVPSERTYYFPNGVKLPEFWRLPQRGTWRARNGFRESDFLIVYSGNVGHKQGLDSLLHAAAKITDPAIRFLICGEGVALSDLRALAEQLKLQNVSFFPLQPEASYRELLIDSDVCVIPQKAGGGNCFFPSKLLTSLVYSRPILAITESDTELAARIREGGLGVIVPASDPAKIAQAVQSLPGDPERLREMGRAGFKFVKQFDQQALLAAFQRRLEHLVGSGVTKKNAAGGASRSGTGAETKLPVVEQLERENQEQTHSMLAR